MTALSDTERVSNHITNVHTRASGLVGLALALGDFSAWSCVSGVWKLLLSTEERAALAYAALKALKPPQAEAVAQAVLGDAGPPLAPFLNPLEDATWWADIASPAELRAYCLAAFDRLPPHEQRDFLEFAQGVAA